jgi:hypothetical protein
MNETSALRFEVSRSNLRETRFVPDPDAPGRRPLADGEVRLRIDSFALTANNITYAAFGEAMKYWNFFPTGDMGWGCIPVWGFADVVESRMEGVEGLAVGERCYGFWPMARYLVVQPVRVKAGGFSDGAAHRQGLAAVYNQIVRCAADPGYRAASEAEQALLRPLFTTSFLIDDFLAESGFFGAGQVVLSSASSKTAYGTAFCLSRRRGSPGAPRIVGLTSPGNLDFAQSLGCYDEVLSYDGVTAMAADVPAVYVDFAGNAALRRRVHEHFNESLAYSCSVGGTHWDELGSGAGLPGPRPTLFFAPAQIAKRAAPPPAGWGGAVLQSRIAEAWTAFMSRVADPVAPWLRVTHGDGPDAVQVALQSLLAGESDPRAGCMLSL